ncbi:MAG: transporter ATP-binding protein [Massilia sp.]|nr:transporter ATP-binding protein [Massilia sp.]
MTAAAADTIIDVRGLTKRYGDKVVVDHLDLRVRRGRIHGFLGPNGSGKTTTIRMLCGLLTPDEGAGSCLGFDLRTQAASIKREVGYMTQKFGLYDDLTIAENLDFIARVYAIAGRRARVDATLAQLRLAGRRNQLAGSLSGGWKQRLALAACLLHAPQLLLLDEPTAGVDPKARREFWDQLHVLADHGMTVLVSTHYMDEAERCHSLAYIAYGKLLAQGSAAELIAQARLSTCEVAGAPALLMRIADAVRTHPGIRSVASFGAALHIAAASAADLDAALAPWRREEVMVTPVATTLEDVFIALMDGATDNVAGAAP